MQPLSPSLTRSPRHPPQLLCHARARRRLHAVAHLLLDLQPPLAVRDPLARRRAQDGVFLASDDSILSAERVRLYLRRSGLREVRSPRRVGDEPGGGGLKVFEGLKHGESMIGEGAPFEEVMRWVTWDARDPTAYESGASGSSSEAPAPAGA